VCALAIAAKGLDIGFMVCSNGMQLDIRNSKAQGEPRTMPKTETVLDSIKCPGCGEVIAISETIYHQVAERAERDLKARSVRQERALADREKQLQAREETFDQRIQEQVKAATVDLKAQAEQQARQSVSLEIEDLRRRAAEKDEKLQAAEKAELGLRKQKRELEERERRLELETARKLDEERRKIEDQAARQVEERYRLKDAEKDKKLQDALVVNEELRRKLQQGSEQTQGEVLELELEEQLRTTFPFDHIEAVPKGMNGADLIHRVHNRNGHCCGTIVWESKRTKAWSDGWIQKLKDDLRLAKGDLAVIASEALPKDITNFTQLKGIWVTSRECALNLAAALRSQLIELSVVKAAAIGKNEKMEILYKYLSGSEFKQRIEAIVEAFIGMQEDLNEERRTAERRWSKREKQIQRVICNTSGMYGDLQGLIGSSLHNIPALTYGDHDPAIDTADL
jgi:hypothetical protein